jgi:hypothetical protein
MQLRTTLYTEQAKRMPQSGKHVIGQFDANHMVVYQAYKPSIGKYASQANQLGGSEYSFTRMSWIKPNFLWMMYRCGWATKLDQESVLALWLKREYFEQILATAVHSSYKPGREPSEKEWKQKLANSDVCLQWDPDHAPYGNKLNRRAIQLGLRRETLQRFATEWIVEIQDITNFVVAQRKCLETRRLDQLIVPEEDVYLITNPDSIQNLGMIN